MSAVSIDHGRVLLIRRSPPIPELWAPPGGKVEPHEGLLKALMRETYEEIGISLRPLRLIAEIELYAPSRSYVLFSFLCEPPIDPDAISAHSDALDARWLQLNEAMAMPLAPGVTTTLMAISDGRKSTHNT